MLLTGNVSTSTSLILPVKAGVEYRFKSRVKSLLFDSGTVKGVALKEDRVEANVVIDAEGCSSAILKQTGLEGLKASMTVRGIQAEVDGLEGVDEDMVEVYLGRNVAPDFFAWIIPRKDGTAKVGLATSTGNPHQYLRQLHGEASRGIQETTKKPSHRHVYSSHTVGGSNPQNILKRVSCGGRRGFPSKTDNRRRRHLWANMR